jgi:hypothetical protein
MDAARWGGIVALIWLVAGRASAGAVPLPDPGEQLAGIFVIGAATARDARVDVRCEGAGFEDPAARCAVRVSFVVVADDALELRATTPELVFERPRTMRGELRIDGERLDGTVTRAPGSETRVELAATFELAVTRDWRGTPWIAEPMLTRHFLFGESAAIARRGDGIVGPLVAGAGLRVQGTIEAHVDVPGGVEVWVGEQVVDGDARVTSAELDLRVGLAAPPTFDALVANGGPVLGLGWRGTTRDGDGDGRFELRLGYELALAEYVFGALAFETDFESIMESLVIEIVAPGVAFFVPSVSAGVGVVARQLGTRDADAALRLRLGAVYFSLGVSVDFDYWPAIGDWTTSVVVRLSL